MHLLLLLLAVLAATPPTAAQHSAIEATIRGTAEPLEVDLLLRNPADQWTEAGHQTLPPETRRVRFDGLGSGVYQLRVRGPVATEQLGTKIGVGNNDIRQITIAIEPYVLTGRVTLGETELGAGHVVLKHRELQWRAAIALGADGTFRAPLWQRGTFDCYVRSPALATDYASTLELDGAPPPLKIEIPDGRITGIVRDARSGAPVEGAIVALRTSLEQREENVKLTTGPDGRFDFTGIKSGRHTVQILPPHHLTPEPIVFSLGGDSRLRQLDVRVDPGRAVAIVAIDEKDHPVANAKVFAVAGSKVRARATTDEDGRATVALPAGETATLFVIPEEGPFGVLPVAPDPVEGRLQVHLPRTSSSLLIRASTTSGATMPPFSLLMRYNGELVPPDVADELTTLQGLQLMTDPNSEAHLENIPTGTYEFWPYRTENEAESIMASADALIAPILVNVREGENQIAVKFAARRGAQY
jgi:Carboxypeptidase regulatory-like domain